VHVLSLNDLYHIFPLILLSHPSHPSLFLRKTKRGLPFFPSSTSLTRVFLSASRVLPFFFLAERQELSFLFFSDVFFHSLTCAMTLCFCVPQGSFPFPLVVFSSSGKQKPFFFWKELSLCVLSPGFSNLYCTRFSCHLGVLGGREGLIRGGFSKTFLPPSPKQTELVCFNSRCISFSSSPLFPSIFLSPPPTTLRGNLDSSLSLFCSLKLAFIPPCRPSPQDYILPHFLPFLFSALDDLSSLSFFSSLFFDPAYVEVQKPFFFPSERTKNPPHPLLQ